MPLDQSVSGQDVGAAISQGFTSQQQVLSQLSTTLAGLEQVLRFSLPGAHKPAAGQAIRSIISAGPQSSQMQAAAAAVLPAAAGILPNAGQTSVQTLNAAPGSPGASVVASEAMLATTAQMHASVAGLRTGVVNASATAGQTSQERIAAPGQQIGPAQPQAAVAPAVSALPRPPVQAAALPVQGVPQPVLTTDQIVTTTSAPVGEIPAVAPTDIPTAPADGVPPPPPPVLPPTGGPPASPPPPSFSSASSPLIQGAPTDTGLLSKGADLIKSIPVIGTIFSAVTGAMNFGREQVDKNNLYRSMVGPEDNSGALTDSRAYSLRAGEANMMTQYSRLWDTTQQAEAFKTAVSMGYNDYGPTTDNTSRKGATDFMYHAQDYYSADLEESSRVLALVSTNAQVSLEGLNQSLRDLSQMAGTAGVNATQARTKMENYLATSMAMGYGSGSTQVALAMGEAQTSLGKSFVNVDTSGQMTSDYEYLMAGVTGQSQHDIISARMSDPVTDAQNVMKTVAGLDNFFSTTQMAWLKQQVKINESMLVHDPGYAMKIAEEFWRGPMGEGSDVNAFMQQFTFWAGTNVGGVRDEVTALAYYINTRLMGENVVAKASDTQTNIGRTNLSGKNLQTGQTSKLAPGVSGMRSSLQDGAFTASGDGSFLSNSLAEQENKMIQSGVPIADVKALMAEGAAAGFDTSLTNATSSATKAYWAAAKKSGQRSTIIEKMLGQMTPAQEDSQMVTIKTNKGYIDVPLKQAVKNFQAQIESGDATLVGGENDSKSITDVYNESQVDTTRQHAAFLEANRAFRKNPGLRKLPTTDKPGTSGADAWQGSRQKVEVVFSGDAAKFFKVLTKGTVDQSAEAYGRPKTNDNANVGSPSSQGNGGWNPTGSTSQQPSEGLGIYN